MQSPIFRNTTFPNIWNFLQTYPSFHILNTEDGIFYTLAMVQSSINPNQWNYCFQEEGSNYARRCVCSGVFMLNTDIKTVLSQTIRDKYNNCFEPNFAFIMHIFFEDIHEYYPCPIPISL